MIQLPRGTFPKYEDFEVAYKNKCATGFSFPKGRAKGGGSFNCQELYDELKHQWLVEEPCYEAHEISRTWCAQTLRFLGWEWI